MNHIAPGRIILLQPDNRMAKEYLEVDNYHQESTENDMQHLHEHSPSDPVVKHGRQRRLEKKYHTRQKAGFRK